MGRKLWERQYVDGNGGNISARISSDYVICTPTLCSKGTCAWRSFAGGPRQCSGLRRPSADQRNSAASGDLQSCAPRQSVIHCHPPYATAHAVPADAAGQPDPRAGSIRRSRGPGSLRDARNPAFARTVLPFVENHNTILLANHGIVCWADTVTHAEWYVEVVETYCKTVFIASQLRPAPGNSSRKDRRPAGHQEKAGLPDPRLVPSSPSQLDDANNSRAGPWQASRRTLSILSRPPSTRRKSTI